MTTAFALALDQALSPGDPRRIASALGVSESNISAWRRGDHGISIEHAIAVEEALKLEPGTLTIHLGFLPPAAATVTISSPEDAIIADPDLDGDDKRILLATLKRLRDR